MDVCFGFVFIFVCCCSCLYSCGGWLQLQSLANNEISSSSWMQLRMSAIFVFNYTHKLFSLYSRYIPAIYIFIYTRYAGIYVNACSCCSCILICFRRARQCAATTPLALSQRCTQFTFKLSVHGECNDETNIFHMSASSTCVRACILCVCSARS